MLSNRKKIAVSASLLMATRRLSAAAPPSRPLPRPPKGRRPPQRARKAAVTVSLVPGVIGPGGGLQSSKKGQLGSDRQDGTGKVGKKVALQRESGVEPGDRLTSGRNRQEGQA